MEETKEMAGLKKKGGEWLNTNSSEKRERALGREAILSCLAFVLLSVVFSLFFS